MPISSKSEKIWYLNWSRTFISNQIQCSPVDTRHAGFHFIAKVNNPGSFIVRFKFFAQRINVSSIEMKHLELLVFLHKILQLVPPTATSAWQSQWGTRLLGGLGRIRPRILCSNKNLLLELSYRRVKDEWWIGIDSLRLTEMDILCTVHCSNSDSSFYFPSEFAPLQVQAHFIG